MRISRSSFPLLAVLAWMLASVPTALRAQDKPVAEKQKVEKIGVDEFDKKRQEKDAVVLDVRSREEYAAGHVPGSVNLDIHDPKFDDKLGQLDRSKTYLVHCAKGYRSGLATSKMATMGFPSLFDFHGGFTAWENAHKPVEKGPGDGKDASK